MVKHIILWKLKEEFSEEEKKQIKAGIKEGLEGLAGQIPGMTEIKVRIDCLPSSTVDVMLDSIALSLEADAEEATKRMVTLMEPLLIMMMAVIVGFIMIAVMLPIYESYSAIENS